MHHRKASVGNVTLDNNHPFIGSKFMLSQNGTAKEWYISIPMLDRKETDSETLLWAMEKECDTLLECVTFLNNIKTPVGTINIFYEGNMLVWSDATRGTYVDIHEQTNVFIKD